MLTAVVRGLAAVDAVLLCYFVLTHNWLNFAASVPTESIASLFLTPMLWALMIGEKLFFAAFFAVVGFGIWRSLKGAGAQPSWVGRLASPVLLLALAGIALVWYSTMSGVLGTPPGFLNDRLTLFDSLAHHARDYTELWGTAHYTDGSAGRYLVILLGAAYLAEKYLLASWGVRCPLPLLPLAAVGWVGFAVYQGERGLRDYVTAREWRVVAPEQSWLDAVAACEAMGPGWRLPRREELSRYLASGAAVPTTTGAAWTNTTADDGSRSIAVDLAPRLTGRWNKGSELLRDESLCEYRDQPG